MVRKELGSILKVRKEELVQSWAERSKRSNERYGERPIEEIKGNLGTFLDAIIELADTDNRTAVEEVVRRVYRDRVRAGLGFEDTSTVIFIGIEEGIRVLERECEARGESSHCLQLGAELIDLFSEATVPLAQTLDGLAAGKAELFAMVSGLEAAVYVADMETYELLAVNPMLEESFGPDLVGKTCYKVLQQGQTGPCAFCTNDKLMKNGEPTGPYNWKFKNSLTGRWYHCIDKAVKWPDGRHVRLEVAFDITEAEKTRAETESARSLLELYNDILLHDLGNFAGTTLGYLDLALSDPTLGEDGSRLVGSARGQARKCSQLIDKISRFSKVLTAGDEEHRTTNLNLILDEAVEEAIEIHADQRPVVRKEYDKSEHLARLGAFPKDVFLNLLTNAIKYGAGEEVVVRVDEDHQEGRPAWKVSVIDNGPGISPEDKEKIFQRYARLESPKRPKGRGLGLSIAKTVTNRYGGEIRVEDRVPGDHTKGACFIVTFPKA